ncbi:MAG: 16S rRNA (guanine(527)-N(7))-methyltransferase RsmG [Bacilli bacterium]
MEKNIFNNLLENLNIQIDDSTYSNLNKYYKILVEENEKYDLTNIIKKDEVFLKHFFDSLTLNKAVDLTKDISLCDVGTGAGFPGLVLKIVFPNIKVTLVDAKNKRCIFLKMVIDVLKLKDIEVVCERSEEYATKNREKFDIVTARAVAKLNIISEYCVPMLKINGKFIPMKANVVEEIENTQYLKKLGAQLENIIKFILPIEKSNRTLIIIKKITNTNSKFPRRYSDIVKKPL